MAQDWAKGEAWRFVRHSVLWIEKAGGSLGTVLPLWLELKTCPAETAVVSA